MRLVPLESADLALVSELLLGELDAWRTDLGWDYSTVQSILLSFMERGALPGFLATEQGRPAGYTYFLIQRHKGVIGTVYRSGNHVSHHVVDLLQQAAIDALRSIAAVNRIEAQIVPFGGISLDALFLDNGFECHPRHFLELDASSHLPRGTRCDARVVPWDSSYLMDAARVAFAGYSGQSDALICEDYHTEKGCEGYLRSLLDTPGCGTFLPSDSHMAIDGSGTLCGFIIASSISPAGAMIPQISILPSHQGQGIGNALMEAALGGLRARGYRSVGLMVTVGNSRAYSWYLRLGFRTKKAFSAATWQRR